MTPTDHEALVSLKEYVEAQIAAEREIREARISGIERATEIAHRNLETRLGSMNEIREQLREQAEHFASKESVDNLAVRIGKIENALAGMAGSNIGKVQIVIVSVSAVIMAIGAIVTLTHMLRGG